MQIKDPDDVDHDLCDVIYIYNVPWYITRPIGEDVTRSFLVRILPQHLVVPNRDIDDLDRE